MRYNVIKDENELEIILKDNMGVLLYFSRITCSVGEALEPKVKNMLDEEFPKIPFYLVDMDKTTSIAASFSVFVEPTIIIFFEGKETIRKSRIISIPELSKSLKRIYKIAFE